MIIEQSIDEIPSIFTPSMRILGNTIDNREYSRLDWIGLASLITTKYNINYGRVISKHGGGVSRRVVI